LRQTSKQHTSEKQKINTIENDLEEKCDRVLLVPFEIFSGDMCPREIRTI
jgi:hypothetical protein